MLEAIAKLRRIYRTDEPFDFSGYPNDVQGWNFATELFPGLVALIRPAVIVEVGTWLGASALAMARAAATEGLDTRIVCVDTWLGNVEFLVEHNPPADLRNRCGFPQAQLQFWANVCHAGFQDVITPFPQTSAIAARWLWANGVRPDLCYIDASHEEFDVMADLESYWPLVRDGGVLFGDDFNWNGVKRAVIAFQRAQGVEVYQHGVHWLIPKGVNLFAPAATQSTVEWVLS